MKFNINEIVRVKLTEYGKKVHEEDHKEFWGRYGKHHIQYTPPKEDAEGWSEWQLWGLMESFGKHIHIGAKNPFETEIDIPSKKEES